MKQENEVWRPVSGYEGLYEVSDLGRVRSIKRSKMLKPSKTPTGYLRLTLSGVNKNSFSVHRIVMLSFSERVKGLNEVNHINGIKTDNRIENLEWCNRSTNVLHSYCTGLKKSNLKKGEMNVNSRKIIVFDIAGNELHKFKTMYEASNKLSIDRVSISRVCRGIRKSAHGLVFKYAD